MNVIRIETRGLAKKPADLTGTVSISGEDGRTLLKKQLPLETLFGAYHLSSSVTTGILPPALRWVSPDYSMALFERPPFSPLVEVVWATKSDAGELVEQGESVFTEGDGNGLRVRLPMPWTVYLVSFASGFIPHRIFVYTRRQPLQSMDDQLWLLPLPNFYANGEMCNPFSSEIEVTEPSLSAGIIAAYNRVWNSGFNADLREAMKHGQTNGFPVKSKSNNAFVWLKEWGKQSELDIQSRFLFPRPSPDHSNGGVDFYVEPQAAHGYDPAMGESWTPRSLIRCFLRYQGTHNTHARMVNTIGSL